MTSRTMPALRPQASPQPKVSECPLYTPERENFSVWASLCPSNLSVLEKGEAQSPQPSAKSTSSLCKCQVPPKPPVWVRSVT